MANYRLFPSTNGPSIASTSGGWLLGVIFSVSGQVGWFNGYYYWAPASGDTTPIKCALWNRYSASAQSLVPNTTVTSGTLTLNSWNFVPLTNPVQLAPGALYVAAVGWTVTNGIPVASGQFGSGQTYAAGITDGILTGWSATSGSNTFPASTVNYGLGQQLFSNALGSDPSVNMPNNGSGNDFLGMDIQVSDTAPAGYAGSWRLWPNMGDLGNYSNDTANGFTLGTEFSLSQQCTINNIWFYSPSGISQLPTEVGVYQVSGTTLVASNASPSWSGAAGSGWIKTSLAGTLSPSVNYKAVVFQGSNTVWNASVANYWTTGGFGANGLTSGPITAPNNASATSPGQESYNQGASIAYPNSNVGPFNYGVDIELTVQTAFSGTSAIAGTALLSATGIRNALAASAVAAGSKFAQSGTKTGIGTSAIDATGTAAAAGSKATSGTGKIAAGSLLAAAGKSLRSGLAAIAGAGWLRGSGTRSASGHGAITAAGSLSATGGAIPPAPPVLQPGIVTIAPFAPGTVSISPVNQAYVTASAPVPRSQPQVISSPVAPVLLAPPGSVTLPPGS